MTAASGASAVPADGGSSLPFPGGSDIMPAGTMTGVRGARCKWVRHRRHVRFVWCTYSRKPGPSCALGTTTPFGKSCGGTPEVVLPPPRGWGSAAACKAAVVTEQRLTAFRFLLFLRRPDEIRGGIEAY